MTFRTLYFRVFFLVFLFYYPVSLSSKPVPLLYKRPIAITVDLKSYSLPGNESITLFGAKRRKFLTDHWFWGEAGYGAISGKRSGYLEGGIIGGWMGPLWKTVHLESRLFLGAGGGGSAPQGGGLIINPTLGLWAELKPGILFGIEGGYIRFLNGDIESATFGAGVTFYFWELSTK